jgi:hypothetical protein
LPAGGKRHRLRRLYVEDGHECQLLPAIQAITNAPASLINEQALHVLAFFGLARRGVALRLLHVEASDYSRASRGNDCPRTVVSLRQRCFNIQMFVLGMDARTLRSPS